MLNLSHFEFLGQVGKGGYGVIDAYRHKDQPDQECVIKTMETDEHLSQVIREIEIYKKLRHPNIVSYLDHRYNTKTTLMLERGRCSLADFINRGQYNIEMYHRWIYQIALGVDYMHHLNLIHTDLKPQNIIIFRDSQKDFYPKICDFGCAQLHQPQKEMKCYIQSEYYRSPEIKSYIDKNRFKGIYDFKIDVWSLGVIMVDLYCHRYSYSLFSYYQAGHLQMLGHFCQKYRYLPPQEGLLELLQGTLLHTPEERWSIRRLLQDPYWQKTRAIELAANRTVSSRNPIANSERLTERLAERLAELPANSERLVVRDNIALENDTNRASAVPVDALSVNTAEDRSTEDSFEFDNCLMEDTDSESEECHLEVDLPNNNRPNTPTIKDAFANNYASKHKGLYRYPVQDPKMLDLIRDYYNTVPERMVVDGYYFALKMQKRVKTVNFWRLVQYCIYILSLLYYDEPPDFLKSIFLYKKRELFQILNATDFVLF